MFLRAKFIQVYESSLPQSPRQETAGFESTEKLAMQSDVFDL